MYSPRVSTSSRELTIQMRKYSLPLPVNRSGITCTEGTACSGSSPDAEDEDGVVDMGHPP
jgi:hypothetical protein